MGREARRRVLREVGLDTAELEEQDGRAVVFAALARASKTMVAQVDCGTVGMEDERGKEKEKEGEEITQEIGQSVTWESVAQHEIGKARKELTWRQHEMTQHERSRRSG